MPVASLTPLVFRSSAFQAGLLFLFAFFRHASNFCNGFLYFFHILARFELVCYKVKDYIHLIVCHRFVHAVSFLCLPITRLFSIQKYKNLGHDCVIIVLCHCVSPFSSGYSASSSTAPAFFMLLFTIIFMMLCIFSSLNGACWNPALMPISKSSFFHVATWIS